MLSFLCFEIEYLNANHQNSSNNRHHVNNPRGNQSGRGRWEMPSGQTFFTGIGNNINSIKNPSIVSGFVGQIPMPIAIKSEKNLYARPNETEDFGIVPPKV